MGRSPGGLIAAQSHIKMNKLLLALAAGSSEEENRVESFESGLDREAREADPARRQRKDQAKRKNQTEGKNQAQRKNQAERKNKAEKKNQAKRKNQAQRKNQAKRKNKAEKENQAKRKNKKGKSNKRNGLKAKRGGKGQKGKRNNRKNTAEARQCRVTTTCSDTAVAAHKLMKDMVDNFVKQHKRITKKTNIGSKKSNKNDVFKPVLQRLAAAAGGNISAPVCSGSSNNSGAAQMLNLSITLKNCEDDIYAACDPSNLPNHNQSKIAECYAAIDIFTNYTDTCSDLSGAAACDCWIPVPM